MPRKKQDAPERVWVGVFGAGTPSGWVARELELEKLPDDAFGPGAQPVSVRVDLETLALLDAFAQRFKTSRSGVLLELIRSGLSEAFQALPEDEQHTMAEAVRAKAPKAGGLVALPKIERLPSDEQA